MSNRCRRAIEDAVVFFLVMAIAGCWSTQPVPLGNEGEKDSGPETDTDTDTDTDSDTDTDTDTDTNVDTDDTDWSQICDECSEIDDGSIEQLLAVSMEVCDPEWIMAAQTVSTSPGGGVAFDSLGHDTNPCFSDNVCGQMAAIGTGPVGWGVDPNSAEDMGGTAAVGNDPQPEFIGHWPCAEEKTESCDVSQLVLELRAPEGVTGFQFDFLFATAEYSEWVNMGYADTFYAIVEDANLNGGGPTNIAYDFSLEEINVNSSWLEDNDNPCDESGTDWSPSTDAESGSTGWLRTRWSVEPLSELKLTFSIHDEGDCSYDSMVLVDGFRWIYGGFEEGTAPRP